MLILKNNSCFYNNCFSEKELDSFPKRLALMFAAPSVKQMLLSCMFKFSSVKEYFSKFDYFFNKINNIDKKKRQNEDLMCSQDLN